MICDSQTTQVIPPCPPNLGAPPRMSLSGSCGRDYLWIRGLLSLRADFPPNSKFVGGWFQRNHPSEVTIGFQKIKGQFSLWPSSLGSVLHPQQETRRRLSLLALQGHYVCLPFLWDIPREVPDILLTCRILDWEKPRRLVPFMDEHPETKRGQYLWN